MEKPHAMFKPGDSVVVKSGVRDPLWNTAIEGWQGRVVELRPATAGFQVCIEWDSPTLRALPAEFIGQCEARDLDWTALYLDESEVEPATPRDTEAEARRTAEELARRYTWLALGHEGQRIQNVLTGIDPDDEPAALAAWERYLNETLVFPFQVEVVEGPERGPIRPGQWVKVHKLAGIDPEKGIQVEVDVHRRRFVLPLIDLEPVDMRNPNYFPVDEYITWYTSRHK